MSAESPGTCDPSARSAVTCFQYCYLVLFIVLKRKHERTLQAIYRVEASIKWRDIEALLEAAGCRVLETRGSMVRIQFPSGSHVVIHRPHPSPETGQDRVRRLRRLLQREKIKP